MSEIAKSEPVPIKSIFDKFKDLVNMFDYSYIDYQIDQIEQLELRIVQLERELVTMKDRSNKLEQHEQVL